MARKLFILIAALALVAAACGGGDDTADTPSSTAATTQAPSQDATTTAAPSTTAATTTAAPATTTTAAPSTPMASTFRDLVSDESFEAMSARFEAVFEFATDGSDDLPPMAEMKMEGAYNNATKSSQIMVDFGSIFGALGEEVPPGFEDFFSEPMEIIQIGTTSWVKWGFFAFFTGPDVEWIEFEDEEADDFVSDFSFGFDATQNPFDNIDELGNAGVMVQEIGPADVRGVATTHYRVTLDAETLSEELTDEEAQELRDNFGAGSLEDLQFDVFIGADRLLYRYVLDLDASAIPDSEGLEGLKVTFDIYDYNADIMIDPPPPESVTSGDELGNLFGGFLGGG